MPGNKKIIPSASSVSRKKRERLPDGLFSSPKTKQRKARLIFEEFPPEIIASISSYLDYKTRDNFAFAFFNTTDQNTLSRIIPAINNPKYQQLRKAELILSSSSSLTDIADAISARPATLSKIKLLCKELKTCVSLPQSRPRARYGGILALSNFLRSPAQRLIDDIEWNFKAIDSFYKKASSCSSGGLLEGVIAQIKEHLSKIQKIIRTLSQQSSALLNNSFASLSDAVDPSQEIKLSVDALIEEVKKIEAIIAYNMPLMRETQLFLVLVINNDLDFDINNATQLGIAYSLTPTIKKLHLKRAAREEITSELSKAKLSLILDSLPKKSRLISELVVDFPVELSVLKLLNSYYLLERLTLKKLIINEGEKSLALQSSGLKMLHVFKVFIKKTDGTMVPASPGDMLGRVALPKLTTLKLSASKVNDVYPYICTLNHFFKNLKFLSLWINDITPDARTPGLINAMAGKQLDIERLTLDLPRSLRNNPTNLGRLLKSLTDINIKHIDLKGSFIYLRALFAKQGRDRSVSISRYVMNLASLGVYIRGGELNQQTCTHAFNCILSIIKRKKSSDDIPSIVYIDNYQREVHRINPNLSKAALYKLATNISLSDSELTMLVSNYPLCMYGYLEIKCQT